MMAKRFGVSALGRHVGVSSFVKLVVEGVVGALVALIVLIAVVSNLPAGSSLKQSLEPVLTPIAMATGLEQYWSMYAPNPPQRLEELEVHVLMADGADRVWTLPLDQDPVVGVAVSHRWRKLRETLYGDARSRRRWRTGWSITSADQPSALSGCRSLCTQRHCRRPGTTGPETPGQRSSTRKT